MKLIQHTLLKGNTLPRGGALLTTARLCAIACPPPARAEVNHLRIMTCMAKTDGKQFCESH
eukprot:4899535-Amphidinium_carterae.1